MDIKKLQEIYNLTKLNNYVGKKFREQLLIKYLDGIKGMNAQISDLISIELCKLVDKFGLEEANKMAGEKLYISFGNTDDCAYKVGVGIYWNELKKVNKL